MIPIIKISEFRLHLKDYLDEVSDMTISMFQIGTKKGNLVMSEKTLEKLQKRHYVNTWSKNRFKRLKLDNYTTLANGSGTKDLPLDTLLALSSFFGLVTELMELLAHPGAKSNAAKWKVAEYIAAGVEKKPLNNRGRFHVVYAIVTRLFQKENFREFLQQGENEGTLQSFFEYILKQEKNTIFRDSLSEKQTECLWEIIQNLCVLSIALINFQMLDGETDVEALKISLVLNQINSWYECQIGSIPKDSNYNIEEDL